MANVVNKINRPVSVWIEKERFDSKRCLTVILRTKGCGWNKCLMCGYSREADERVKTENLKNQLDFALNTHSNFDVLKIFTSGSFFDEREIPKSFEEYVYEKISEENIKKLIVESRPEFISRERLRKIPPDVTAEVGIGLETSNDFVREYCINKGFKFEDFKKAALVLKEENIRVKVYLLLKPPFLSESEAIKDVICSARAVKDYADIISLNLTNVPSKTYIEVLWRRGLYRPPWLWSAVEAIRRIKEIGIEIISDPVAAGKQRGPHNCGKCDADVADAIRSFSLSQRIEELDSLYCDCIHVWKRVVELEDFSRIPLIKSHLT
jgi:hypothetical protein